jgi:mono/diheme cytochrome c family protein
MGTLGTVRRMFRLCTALVALALLLTACGGGGGSDTSSSAPASTGSGGGTQNASASGKQVFTQNCGGCHTLKEAGTSGSVGPNLDDLQPDKATVTRQVNNGGGPMPSFKGKLSPAQINDVATYVSSSTGGS